MATIEDIERMTTRVYGKASAVSVDSESGGWVIRCWDQKGKMVDSSGPPMAKSGALSTMKRRLRRACFLRLDIIDQTGGSASSVSNEDS